MLFIFLYMTIKNVSEYMDITHNYIDVRYINYLLKYYLRDQNIE